MREEFRHIMPGQHEPNERRELEVTEEHDRGGKQLPLLGIALSILLATAAFFSGLQLGGEGGPSLEANLGSLFAPSSQPDESVDLTEFWQVWNLLEDKFVSSTTSAPASDDERVWGAIEGLVRSYGDPYTLFLPPEDASMFEEDISGNFSGVGMEVGVRDNVITVIAPLPDTPAERAGIIAGDVIVRIDERSTEGMSVDEAVRLIRGEEGTEVMLTIFREGEDEFLEFAVVRDTIVIPTSMTEIRDDVFIITLYSFNAIAEAEMQNALREFVASGKRKLILDLRGNPGGFLQSAINISSYFLPVGSVVVRESFGEGEEERVYRSTGRQLKSLAGNFGPDEMVILIDEGSASASEIVAGALKEHGIATLIGSQTFGKGSVQELVELDDGSSLKVTIARWLTPDGTSISEGGLAPDIAVERTPQDRVEGRDPQLDEALSYLAR